MAVRRELDRLCSRRQRLRPRLSSRGGLFHGRRTLFGWRARAAVTVRSRLAGAIWVAVAFGLLAVPAADADVRVTDDTGAAVALASPAQRVVSLAPHATELLFGAGAGTRVVGVMSGSDFPPAATQLPVVGNANALDLERILALGPDLIVTWPYTTPTQVDVLRAQGIAVFTTNPRTIDGIARDIERLGALAGSSPAAPEPAEGFSAPLGGPPGGASRGAAVTGFYWR